MPLFQPRVSVRRGKSKLGKTTRGHTRKQHLRAEELRHHVVPAVAPQLRKSNGLAAQLRKRDAGGIVAYRPRLDRSVALGEAKRPKSFCLREIGRRRPQSFDRRKNTLQNCTLPCGEPLKPAALPKVPAGAHTGCTTM